MTTNDKAHDKHAAEREAFENDYSPEEAFDTGMGEYPRWKDQEAWMIFRRGWLARSALTASEAVPAIPEGYVLMPEKLTPTMKEVLEFGRTQPAHNTYLNLLAAAPSSPAQTALPFTIDAPGSGTRVLTYTEGGCRPATDEECALWDTLKSSPAQQDGWISVSERLPLAYTDVLFVVDCPRDEGLHGRVLGGRYVGGRWGFSVPGMGMGASHWMPAPPSPTGSDAGSDKGVGKTGEAHE